MYGVWGSRGSKSGDLVGCYHGGTTNERTKRKDRATQPLDNGRLIRAKTENMEKSHIITKQKQKNTN